MIKDFPENPFPKSIKKISIVAPAGRPEEKDVSECCKLLSSWGIVYTVGKHVFEVGRGDIYSSSDASRAEDFNNAVRDGKTDLILCARGGYGSGRILDLIDWKAFKSRKKPLGVLGYSDVTALHFAMIKKSSGIAVTAPMAANFCESMKDSSTFNSLKAMLKKMTDKDEKPLVLSDLKRIGQAGEKKSVSGRILCGNLSVAVSLVGTEFMPSPKNIIFAIEDIGEAPRKIDRALEQLLLSGFLDGVKAVILGKFTSCGRKKALESVFSSFAEALPSVPFYHGLEFGHKLPLTSFVNGTKVIIK